MTLGEQDKEEIEMVLKEVNGADDDRDTSRAG